MCLNLRLNVSKLTGTLYFTRNVSKYNYCFSDFPFPDNAPDYPHNKDMASYVVDYMNHFNVAEMIKFHRKVLSVKKTGRYIEDLT